MDLIRILTWDVHGRTLYAKLGRSKNETQLLDCRVLRELGYEASCRTSVSKSKRSRHHYSTECVSSMPQHGQQKRLASLEDQKNIACVSREELHC